LGRYTKEVSKSLYEEFGLEGGKLKILDQYTKEHEERKNNLPGEIPK